MKKYIKLVLVASCFVIFTFVWIIMVATNPRLSPPNPDLSTNLIFLFPIIPSLFAGYLLGTGERHGVLMYTLVALMATLLVINVTVGPAILQDIFRFIVK